MADRYGGCLTGVRMSSEDEPEPLMDRRKLAETVRRWFLHCWRSLSD
jgi:hypothetical protein